MTGASLPARAQPRERRYTAEVVTDPEAAAREFSCRASELAAAGAALAAQGMVPATSGNLSVRLADGDVAITASGRHKGRLTTDDIMVVDKNGSSRDHRVASAETLLHVQIYRRIHAAGAVLHGHSIPSTLLSRFVAERLVLTGYELLKAFPGINTHTAELTVPVFGNDQDIVRLAATVDLWMTANPPIQAYVIAQHGFYTWGATVADALRHAEALDHLLRCELLLQGIPLR